MSLFNSVEMSLRPSELTLSDLRTILSACMQCGSCSASCPNIQVMDISPRLLWRKILLERLDEVLQSHTYWLCSACYTCTLRCPRGLPLTSVMQALKRFAVHQNAPRAKRHGAFYGAFMASVERHGRIQEARMMMRYFASRKSLRLLINSAPLGLKLIHKGKLHLRAPKPSADRRLSGLFERARGTEGEI